MRILQSFLVLSAILVVDLANADVVLSRVDEGNPSWRTNPHIIIRGEILRGDYERALNAVKETYIQGELGELFVRLDSPGGDVLEAMKIGQLVRELKLSTSVHLGRCDSACVFILVAGVNRLSASGIGIHRPFFEQKYFSGLSADSAQKKYREMMKKTRTYLISMDVPTELVERMFRVPSNEIERLSLEDVEKWISGSPASLDEWLIAKCDSYTKDEANDYALWSSHQIELSPGYANYLQQKVRDVDGCRWVTLANERHRFAERLFPKVKLAKMPKYLLNKDASR